MRATLLLTAALVGFSAVATGAMAQTNPDSGQIVQSLKFRGIRPAAPQTPDAPAGGQETGAQANGGQSNGGQSNGGQTGGQTGGAPPPAAAAAGMPTPNPCGALPAGQSSAPQSSEPCRRQAGMAPPPPPPVETPSVSLNVQFPTGSAELTPEAMRTLDQLGMALRDPQLAGNRFRIEGHTDTVGGDGYNMYLSERRAQAVVAYLVQRYGLPRARLVAIGMGAQGLLVPTPPQTPEQQNRRVLVVNMGA
jgi:outer membrane protein OmpA-like peptidoglycan-associated protein